MFYPYHINIFTSPYPIENKVVRSGEYLKYKVSYCKFFKNIPTVSKYFVDGIIYSIPQELSLDNPIGCHTNNIQLYVPRGLPPGNYLVKTVYAYQVNPIRNIKVVTETERFDIVK